ncbi:MAG: hypothetical protein KAJ29_03350 [Alphaproteobacteria bacterium]|nr:hypothetical protein [Alphaproteobacteria bacterium]
MTDALFFRQVDDVLAGKAARDLVLVLGDIPSVYLSLSVPCFKLIMTQQTLQKIITKHTLTVSIIKRLPVLLHSPVMVFKSASEPGAIVAMIDAKDKNGNTIIAIIHPDRRHKQHHVNLIVSVYGKNRTRWFIEQIEEERLLYADKEKTLQWSRSAQLQLPGEVTAARHGQIIKRRLHEVKDNEHPKPLTIHRKKGSDHENQ